MRTVRQGSTDKDLPCPAPSRALNCSLLNLFLPYRSVPTIRYRTPAVIRKKLTKQTTTTLDDSSNAPFSYDISTGRLTERSETRLSSAFMRSQCRLNNKRIHRQMPDVRTQD